MQDRNRLFLHLLWASQSSILEIVALNGNGSEAHNLGDTTVGRVSWMGVRFPCRRETLFLLFSSQRKNNIHFSLDRCDWIFYERLYSETSFTAAQECGDQWTLDTTWKTAERYNFTFLLSIQSFVEHVTKSRRTENSKEKFEFNVKTASAHPWAAALS